MNRLKVKVSDSGACRRALLVEADKSVVDAEYEKVTQEYAKTARISGFREGKAPLKLVERRYAKQVLEEVRNRLVPQCYREALKSKNIVPVAVVGIENVSMNKGQPLSFSVTVDVSPEFKLPKYKGLQLKGNKVDIDDSRIDRAIEQLRESLARFEDVSGRPVQHGDMVQVDYHAVCEGKPVGELVQEAAALGEARDFWMIVGGRELIPGLSEGLIGANAGDTRSITVKFPDDYRLKQMAGITACYTATVKALRAKRLPALDEDFLKHFEADSEKAFREDLRNKLLKKANADERARLKNEIAHLLLERVTLDVPESLVESEIRRIAQDVVLENAARGVSRDEIEKNRDDILDAAGKSSRERVKLGYILNRIAETESIAVNDSELNDYVSIMADRCGTDASRLRQELEKRNALDGIMGNIRAEKTLDFILEQAKVKIE